LRRGLCLHRARESVPEGAGFFLDELLHIAFCRKQFFIYLFNNRNNMEKIFQKSYQKLYRVPNQFKRYLEDKIDWNSRLIGIKGARGAGKTTLLLQYAKEFLPQDNQTLYASLDDLYFTENTLIDFAEQFVIQGGKYLLLDEVHRYQNWSQELKNIYDDQPDLKIVFTGKTLNRSALTK
jgi:hypothetical protein